MRTCDWLLNSEGELFLDLFEVGTGTANICRNLQLSFRNRSGSVGSEKSICRVHGAVSHQSFTSVLILLGYDAKANVI